MDNDNHSQGTNSSSFGSNRETDTFETNAYAGETDTQTNVAETNAYAGDGEMQTNAPDPYFLTEEYKLTPMIKKKKKANTVYFLSVMCNLYDHDGKLSVHAVYLLQIMRKKMPNTTCPQDDELGARIKQLVLFLDDREQRNVFMNSDFVRALVEFRTGSCDLSKQWPNFKQTAQGIQEKRKGALATAMHCYEADPGLPVGLDLLKCFDALITKEGDRYVWKKNTREEARALIAAFRKFTVMLQNGEEFKRRYTHP